MVSTAASTLFFHAHAQNRAAQTAGPQRAYHEDTVEIAFVETGRERCNVEGSEFSVAAGEYTLIPSCHEHSSWVDDVACSCGCIHLRAEPLRALADQMGVAKNARFAAGRYVATPALQGAYRTLQAELAHDDAAHALAVDSITHHFAALLLRSHLLSTSTPPAEQTPRDRLRRAEELIRADCAEPLTLESLAQVAGLSPMHFLRSFKKAYGKSPYAYLLDVRLDRAALLMKQADVPLTTIAFEVGFGSSSRFTEAWKKRTGMTPSLWRQRTA